MGILRVTRLIYAKKCWRRAQCRWHEEKVKAGIDSIHILEEFPRISHAKHGLPHNFFHCDKDGIMMIVVVMMMAKAGFSYGVIIPVKLAGRHTSKGEVRGAR